MWESLVASFVDTTSGNGLEIDGVKWTKALMVLVGFGIGGSTNSATGFFTLSAELS
jgi:hypothetical protein